MNDPKRICREEYQTVLRFLLRLTGDEALSAELTQETFYQALRQWKRFRGHCAPSTWLCGIAKRLYRWMPKNNGVITYRMYRYLLPDQLDKSQQNRSEREDHLV